MASIKTMVQVGDVMSGPLNKIYGALDRTTEAFERMQAVSERTANPAELAGVRSGYAAIQLELEEIERTLGDIGGGQEEFNNKVQSGARDMGGLQGKIMGVMATYASLQTLKKALDLSDMMTLTTARLNLMNDGLQTTKELQMAIFAAAMRSRGEYAATADAISKMGIMAQDAFSSNSELIAFMEQINKQFKIAGTSQEGMNAAMLQLTQAMGSGVLRGDELNSIFEQAPTIIQSIADYLDVPIGKIRDMAAEGQITAEIVKDAMFAAADSTNAAFASIPMTWADRWVRVKNVALLVFQPLLEKLSEFANSEAFDSFEQKVFAAMQGAATAIEGVLDYAIDLFTFIDENWSLIEPIIYGIVTALGMYLLQLGYVKAEEMASFAVRIMGAASTIAYAIATGTLTTATAGAIAAQWGFNAAMLANPITWIILAIILLIVIIFMVIAAINSVTGSSISAIGIIMGALAVAAAFIGNLFVAIINFAIDVFVVLWNFIAAFANFFANVFTDPVGAINRLFFDLVDVVLSLLQSLASAIDTIFGSSLASAVQGWRDSLAGAVDAVHGEGITVMAEMDASSMHLGRFEYGAAWDAGYNFGEGIGGGGSMQDILDEAMGDSAGLDDWGSVPGNMANTAGNTGEIANAIDISSEDLKYLRDLAERDVINRFTTAEVKVEMGGVHNTVNKDTDLDGTVAYFAQGLEEALEEVSEGVHR